MTAPPVNAMVDMRGFTHELAALHQRREWECEALEAKLGAAQRSVAQAQVKREELAARHETLSRQAALALQQRVDAGMHRRALAFLLQVQVELQAARLEVSRTELLRDKLRVECIGARLNVEMLIAHRNHAIEDYARQALSKQAAESDREWIARIQWRDQAAMAGPGRRPS